MKQASEHRRLIDSLIFACLTGGSLGGLLGYLASGRIEGLICAAFLVAWGAVHQVRVESRALSEKFDELSRAIPGPKVVLTTTQWKAIADDNPSK